jgi:hypothetical protein
MRALAASLPWFVACEGGHLINVRAMRPFPTLATPTTVSPTSATEQEHHQQNDQYGFHNVGPHL